MPRPYIIRIVFWSVFRTICPHVCTCKFDNGNLDIKNIIKIMPGNAEESVWRGWEHKYCERNGTQESFANDYARGSSCSS